MSDPAERIEQALELAEIAEEMSRLRLRRERPHASDDEIDALVARWYGDRPGAEHGDAEGRPVTIPRG
jgi:hypothetical protein